MAEAKLKNRSCRSIIAELKKLGKESHRKTYIRHGAPPEKLFGVPIGELKPIQKAIKKDYQLALDLFDTGITDAMYLAGLIADESQMTRSDLNKWARNATWSMICSSVASVTAESTHAVALALKWIESKKETVASIGWMTLTSFVSVTPDEEVDLPLCERLLERIAAEIHEERNQVKDSMNGFVIGIGSFVSPLKEKALEVACRIGKVDVDVGETACRTPDATDYITKVAKMKRTGKKRKSARC